MINDRKSKINRLKNRTGMAEESSASEMTVATDGDNLPDVVASLEMLTVASASGDCETSPVQKMVLRKNVRKLQHTQERNRRWTSKPIKRLGKEDSIREYYLDKNVRRKPNNLETIFEEPDDATREEISRFMGSRRLKRMIPFQREPTDAKIKKRRAKVKRIFGATFLTQHKKASMQTLINKLNTLNAESLVRITEDSRQAVPELNPYDATESWSEEKKTNTFICQD